MIIAYDNKYSTATLSATNENPVYPIENTQDIRLSRLFKTIADTSVITVNLGSSLPVSAVFIANHDILVGATITIKGHTTADFTTPDYSSTITWRAGMMYKLITGYSKQFWQISITNGANFKIGGLFFGTYATVTNTFSHVLSEAVNDTTKVFTSLSGQTYTDVGYQYKTYDLNFPKIQVADKTALNAIMTAVRKRPVYIMLDQSGVTEFEPLYCTIDDLTYSRVYTDFYTTSMKLTEAK